MAEDIEDLLARARRGEPLALDRLLDRYRSRIRSLVRKKLGDGLRKNVESSDIVQSVCLEAVKGIAEADLTSEEGLLAWLARLADNTIKDKNRYFKAQKRRVEAQPDDGEFLGLSQVPGAGPTPSRDLGRVERMEFLMQALKRLPEDYRRVILLVRFEKKSHEEAARIMGRSERATRMLLARARVRLLKSLDGLLNDRPDTD